MSVGGNPIDDDDTYFTPQNGGDTPTDEDRSRYATITYYDYQKDAKATVQADTSLQALLGLSGTEIGQLIDHVDDQMKATDGTGGIPAGFEMNLGDVNGDGTGSGTGTDAAHVGNVVKVQHPSVRLLAPPSAAGVYALMVQAHSPYVYWPMNELAGTTALDSSGNGFSAPYLGTYTLGSPGAIVGSGETAAHFTNGAVNRAMTPVSSHWSLELWAKHDVAVDTVVNYLLIDGPVMHVRPQYGYIATLVHTSAGYEEIRAGTVTVGDWLHVVATWSGSNLRLFLNGTQLGSISTSPQSASATGLWASYPGDPSVIGSMNECVLYTSVLSPDDVTAHYRAGAGLDAWVWVNQPRVELFTSNLRGQVTTRTDPEGNLTVYVRYPENDPEGDGQFISSTLSGQQYGRIREVHADADPADVMSLVGSEGDLVDFVGNKIARSNTPGVYLDLVTRHEGTGGCGSCAYDALGNPLTVTDARGFTTVYDRNELGEAYRVTSPTPYNFQTETYFDANRNVTRVDTEDRQVDFTSADPTDANFAHFLASGNPAGVANLPMKAGPGGAVRPGWFTNLFVYNLLDDKIEQDIDATGSTPSSLVTTYAYDPNQNLIQVRQPEENTIEHDYDERNLRIATRVGYDPANDQPSAVSVTAYDGNGNVIDVIGPAQRGGSGTSLSVIIDDAFRSGEPMTHVGDWLVENVYDGFDRNILSTDAVGNTSANTFDPDGRSIASVSQGPVGGATPTDRTGSGNVDLASGETRFDEAGRVYESEQEVYLSDGVTLPSGRPVAHTGGGLASNSTDNNHTGTVTLTTSGESYTLTRTAYDRAGRTIAVAQDNTGLSVFAYDGAGRKRTATDALGNIVAIGYDNNGNATQVTRTEKATLDFLAETPVAVADEVFVSSMRYDCLNQLVVSIDQGSDATEATQLVSFAGYDSRGNRTVTIDPKGNTTLTVYDGASRPTELHQHLRQEGDGTNPPEPGQSFTGQGRAVIRTQSVLDGNGRLKQLIDDRGAATNYAYDTLNRQITMTFVDGSVRTSGYNLASDVVTYTDENGSVFTSTFDPLGRRTAVSITLATNVVGTTAQSFEYDGLSRLTSSTDSIGADDAVALFFYDSLGRVVEEAQTFDGNTRYVTHDAFTSYPATDTTLPNDRQIAMRYDLLYRKDLVNETDGAVLIAKWRFIGPGRTLELELGNGLVCTQLNNDRTHSAVQVGVSNPAWGNQSSDRLGYDGAGRMSTKRYLSDEVNDGTGVYANPASLVGFTTSFDPASNKTYERHLHAENRSHLYPNYDSADRLLEYQRGTPASGGASVSTPITLPGTNTLQNYDLDGLGNWKKTQFSPAGGSLTTQQRRHNYLNQITKFGATTVLYDHGNNAASGDPLIAQRGNGNLTDDGTLTLKYDALNRLKQAFRRSDSQQIAEYTYDALGRRIRKVVTHGGITGNSDLNGTTDFLLDGVQVVEERNVNDDEIKQYVWGHYVDELIQIKTYTDIGAEPLTAGNYYLLSDLLYRSVALTDDSGSIVEVYDTDAYGNTICYKSPGTGSNWFAADAVTTDNPANTTIFTGREFDAETRLYYYRARYYRPTLGTFASKDIFLRSLDPYAYALSNPIFYSDPSGTAEEPSDLSWDFKNSTHGENPTADFVWRSVSRTVILRHWGAQYVEYVTREDGCYRVGSQTLLEDIRFVEDRWRKWTRPDPRVAIYLNQARDADEVVDAALSERDYLLNEAAGFGLASADYARQYTFMSRAAYIGAPFVTFSIPMGIGSTVASDRKDALGAKASTLQGQAVQAQMRADGASAEARRLRGLADLIRGQSQEGLEYIGRYTFDLEYQPTTTTRLINVKVSPCPCDKAHPL